LQPYPVGQPGLQMVLVAGRNLDGIGQEDPAEDRLAEQAIAAHVIYAAEKRHAVEVPASDKDHLQTWLSNRVGLKLVAPDLTANGFQLVGGRLLPAGESKAAMLLYEDGNGQRISLFVTTESTENAKGTYAATQDGPEAVYWLDKGYGCAVAGSLPRERLNEVARNAYTQLVNGLAS
ncbi:anti-sigma factor, partial [Mesorhizobium sp. M7A.F.Ca.CA.001.11.2.1]|uniref:anti-sigma factor family protein n=1 Tax=Mesorhizobium sp. M7A.F.Ca.CA.001.11.2.1 TaxID=2496693 RepID=UPI001FE23C18